MYSKENWQSMAEKEPPFGYDDNFQTSPKNGDPAPGGSPVFHASTALAVQKWREELAGAPGRFRPGRFSVFSWPGRHGHVFVIKHLWRFPPQDPAGIVGQPLLHLRRAHIVEVGLFWKKPPYDPVHVLIGFPLIGAVWVAIKNLCARFPGPLGSFHPLTVLELAAVVHGDGAENLPKLCPHVALHAVQ